MALSGAAIGGVAGTVIGFNARCQDSAKHTWCKVDDAVIGLGAGMFAGNTIGAWAGGGRTRCGELEGFARSTAGALIGSVPFTAYVIALHNKRTNYNWPVFFLSITLPFFQAEGATRAVSGC